MLSMSAVTAIDGIFVGQGVGSDGIAAVNIAIPLYMLYTGIGLMIGVGCSVVASIHLSRGKCKVARLNVTQALLFATLITAIPTAVMTIFPETTVRLLEASDYLVPLAVDYLQWFVPSWTFQVWISIALFIIRLDGAPKLAMCCSLITAVINLVLDWIFIFPLQWGVMGAAVATSISLVAGGGVAVIYLWLGARQLRLCPLKLSRKSLFLSVRNLYYQCHIGALSLLAEATMATLIFMGNQIFMQYLGEDGVGAFGIAQSAQPIISYNFGLGYRERVRQAEKIALLTSVCCGAVVTAVFMLFPQILVGIFIDLRSHAAQLATAGFPLFATAFLFFILNLTIIGYYQSVQRVKPATLLALARGFFFLIPSFICLPLCLGTDGIWLALSLSELLTLLLGLLLRLIATKSRTKRG